MAIFKKIKESPFFIIGPCVIESSELVEEIANKAKEIQEKLKVNIIFKASFDKANRTSINSFRGLGLDEGLKILDKIKTNLDLPITTDIHEAYQAEKVGEVVDIIQIPAFLCRQTDLLLAAAKTNKIVNIKKAQFLSGADMQYPLNKVLSTGNSKIMLTERGNIYGYNNLIVDFRNISAMVKFGFPVIMDCTHSVQIPGGMGGVSGGNREFISPMAHAANAFGVSGYFFETHPNPDNALSDGPNMIPLDSLESLIASLV